MILRASRSSCGSGGSVPVSFARRFNPKRCGSRTCDCALGHRTSRGSLALPYSDSWIQLRRPQDVGLRPREDAKICPRASAGVLKSGPGSRWSSKIWPLSPKIVTTWHVTEIFASRRFAARRITIPCTGTDHRDRDRDRYRCRYNLFATSLTLKARAFDSHLRRSFCRGPALRSFST